MLNKKLLKSKMALYGDNNGTLAEAIGCSPQRFSAKINGTDGAEFVQSEIQIIKERYNLENNEAMDIFFAEDVSEEDTKD
jgi:hypothetical protein